MRRKGQEYTLIIVRQGRSGTNYGGFFAMLGE